ncbi:hypothetical protein BC832DRAFT_591235 [Gaertneriomyces semiglobifer]|nr:hypothetical protein BC832DRAFT_591235 [Gaertneriomyces semiglobifer]
MEEERKHQEPGDEAEEEVEEEVEGAGATKSLLVEQRNQMPAAAILLLNGKVHVERTCGRQEPGIPTGNQRGNDADEGKTYALVDKMVESDHEYQDPDERAGSKRHGAPDIYYRSRKRPATNCFDEELRALRARIGKLDRCNADGSTPSLFDIAMHYLLKRFDAIESVANLPWVIADIILRKLQSYDAVLPVSLIAAFAEEYEEFAERNSVLSLKALYLRGDHVDVAAPTLHRLGDKHFPRGILVRLNLSRTNFDCSMAPCVAHLPNLKVFDVSHTNLKDAGLQVMLRPAAYGIAEGLRSLTHLNVSFSFIADASVALITQLPYLVAVDLSNTKMHSRSMELNLGWRRLPPDVPLFSGNEVLSDTEAVALGERFADLETEQLDNMAILVTSGRWQNDDEATRNEVRAYVAHTGMNVVTPGASYTDKPLLPMRLVKVAAATKTRLPEFTEVPVKSQPMDDILDAELEAMSQSSTKVPKLVSNLRSRPSLLEFTQKAQSALSLPSYEHGCVASQLQFSTGPISSPFATIHTKSQATTPFNAFTKLTKPASASSLSASPSNCTRQTTLNAKGITGLPKVEHRHSFAASSNMKAGSHAKGARRSTKPRGQGAGTTTSILNWTTKGG